MNRYSNTRRNLPSTPKRQWRSLSDPFRMAPLDSYASGTSCSAMSPSRGRRLSLRGALVVVATVAVAAAMAITVAAATATREVALPVRGDAMTVCEAARCRRPVGCVRHCMAP